MKINTTHIPGLLIIEPAVHGDSRGCFYEAFNLARFDTMGLETSYVQDNISISAKNTIRGLHYQLEPFAQAKLVQVIKGRVLDVAVDLRAGSPTYGQQFALELSGENNLQFFIPRGFAHGFSVLSDEAIFYYKCDNYFNKGAERGIIFNDPELDIDWQVIEKHAIVSPKDLMLPTLKSAEKNFHFSLK